jgi:hypothetical protein
MALTPLTDPFYTGDICAPLSSYVPVEEKAVGRCCPILPDANIILSGNIETNNEEMEQSLSAICTKLQSLIELERLDDFRTL